VTVNRSAAGCVGLYACLMAASIRLAQSRDLDVIEKIENEADRLLIDSSPMTGLPHPQAPLVRPSLALSSSLSSTAVTSPALSMSWRLTASAT
jgi:hypothetical protein